MADETPQSLPVENSDVPPTEKDVDAGVSEKQFVSPADAPPHGTSDVDEADHVNALDLPRGWKYKQFRVFGHQLYYASPKIQLLMVSFVCFMCPGMFNALGGLGGGGKIDATLADNMNTALYSAFAVFGFFGGTFVNKVGVKWTLAFGGVGYCIYAISLLVSVHASVFGFNIFAGVFLGICAGLLWTAQGTIMVSYPQENQKGAYFAWFWGIFNFGAVVGSLIALGTNINATEAGGAVADSTYIAFIILMAFGAVLALLLVNASDVIRADGSRVILMKNPSWQSELWGLWETIRFEPLVVLLFPMFFVSNWFYVYQQNAVNGAYFNFRTRALNSMLYWLAQIVTALIWGNSLDIASVRRSVRAKIALAILFVLTMVIWGGGFDFEKTYTRFDVNQTYDSSGTALKTNPDWKFGKDWSDPGYVGIMFLYIFYGGYDAAWQASVYWFMGSLSNSGRRSANFVGFYKGIQSIGAAVVNNLDARHLSYKKEFISNWVLLSVSLLVAAPLILTKIQDHVPVEEDLRGTDETVEDVLPAGHPEKHVV
ncbi:unc93 [Hyphodiscus hymeniophilus]|uniref:Unc93 n=1 Tax=Hyphodiscus hymeniophilus TaxID=353542 RepID=A0A9P6VHP8_9HELO|nr:unc93 [Hyphodiscus hymeniophilus]